jgi:hypothetical protein
MPGVHQWPNFTQLRVAPELGPLALLDAVLAVASHQLLAEHPPPDIEATRRGDLPWPRLRLAARLLADIHEMRVNLLHYRYATLDLRDDDELMPPS